jgi:hypothetical protein
MLTGIVKATRTHYAALQHKPSPDRVALDYDVGGILCGTIWVKVDVYSARHPLSSNLGSATNGRRKAEITKLVNRLRAMYPEATQITAEYRDAPSKTPMLDGQRYLQERARRA